MLPRVEGFLQEKKLRAVRKLGKGHSSFIYLVEDRRGKKAVLKAERQKSTRYRMAEREAENLRRANQVGIGPRLVDADLQRRIILMEYIEGKTFAEWLFEGRPGKEELGEFCRGLLRQAKKLDGIGLDHGQLAGRGKNILVRDGKPVVIDWEKGSCKRKCHNARVVEAFLFRNPNSAIAKRVRGTVGSKPTS